VFFAFKENASQLFQVNVNVDDHVVLATCERLRPARAFNFYDVF
jgi:hypothetical protein